ncbi:hypothetical protein PMI35_04348 [Pseudomonas sp. GM78]|nr:hypothetical protein PMI35_04348 [Pseudomonas sp. GM78]
MIRSSWLAVTVAGLLSLGSGMAFSQSSGNDAPIDKGGMPPSTEMNAGSGPEHALPPGAIKDGNAGDADGSSTRPETGSGSTSGGSSMGSGSGSGSGGSGSNAASSGTDKAGG